MALVNKQIKISKICLFRRWFVLTSESLLTFKEEKSYKSPTEVI